MKSSSESYFPAVPRSRVPTNSPKADDSGDEEQFAQIGYTPGASGGSEVEEAASLTLSMVGDAARLGALLSELTEPEFRALGPRLEALRAALKRLPDAPRPRRPIGFQPPKATRQRARRAA